MKAQLLLLLSPFYYFLLLWSLRKKRRLQSFLQSTRTSLIRLFCFPILLSLFSFIFSFCCSSLLMGRSLLVATSWRGPKSKQWPEYVAQWSGVRRRWGCDCLLQKVTGWLELRPLRSELFESWVRMKGRGYETCHLAVVAKVSSFQNDTSGLYGFLAVGSGRTDRPESCIDKSVDLPCTKSSYFPSFLLLSVTTIMFTRWVIYVVNNHHSKKSLIFNYCYLYNGIRCGLPSK